MNDIETAADEFLNPQNLRKMKEKKPTNTNALNHDERTERETLRTAIERWTKEAPEGENRSFIALQAIDEGGDLSAICHISGSGDDLMAVIASCMSDCTPDNPVGSILRAAAIKSLIDLGMISPATPEANDQLQPEAEPHDNNESK